MQYPNPLQPDTPIHVAALPGLCAALWDQHAATMPASSVLHTYEERWFYVSRDAMSDAEHALFVRLVKDVGGGIFLGSIARAWTPRKRRHRHLAHSRLTLAAIDDIITRGEPWHWETLRAAALENSEVRAKIHKICAARAHTEDATRWHGTRYDDWLAWLAANAGR